MHSTCLQPGGNVLPLPFLAAAVEPLVGGGAVERAALGTVRAQLDVVEVVPEDLLHFLTAAVDGGKKPLGAYVVGQVQERLGISPLSEERKQLTPKLSATRRSMISAVSSRPMSFFRNGEWHPTQFPRQLDISTARETRSGISSMTTDVISGTYLIICPRRTDGALLPAASRRRRTRA